MSKPTDPAYETTLHVRDNCLCLQAQRAARALARHFDEAFRSLGLTNGQFSLLMSLNRPEPPTMRAVAELLAMDRTTLTAAVKPLLRRGLLAVDAEAGDRRERRLLLTEEGRRLLSAAIGIWRSTHAAIYGDETESGLVEDLARIPAMVDHARTAARATRRREMIR